MVALVVAAAAVAVLSRGPAASEGPRPDRAPSSAATAGAQPDAAFTIGKPEPLGDGRHESRWTPVRRDTVARAAPRAGARRVARVSTRTPEGTTNLVLALERESDRRGIVWVRARLAVLPNGTTGWIRRDDLGGYTVVDTRLVVDRRRLTATLLRGGRRVFRAPVGIGTDDAPTPPGQFYIRARLEGFDSPVYGPVAFGTSGRSPTLTDWPQGGFVGIHGTNEPGILPGKVSHGCVRLRNADILRLARMMPVGTPLTVR